MRISQDSHGKYHFIGDPAEIPGIFEDELAGLRAVSVRNGRIEVTLAQGVQVREAFRASPEIYSLGAPLVGEDRHISYEIGDLEADVPGSVLLTLVLPPRKPGPVRILQSNLRYEVPGVGEQSLGRDLTVEYTLDRTLTGKVNGRVMNLVDQVSIAKMQATRRRGTQGGQRGSRDAPFEQCDPGHPAPRQRQGDASAGRPDGPGQENPDATNQGGQDHAVAGSGRGAQDADARPGGFEGFFQARLGIRSVNICPGSRSKMVTL